MGFRIGQVKKYINRHIEVFPFRRQEDEEEEWRVPPVVDESIRDVGFVCVYPSAQVISKLDSLNPTKITREGKSTCIVVDNDYSATANYIAGSIVKGWIGVEDEDGSQKPYSPKELYDLFMYVPALLIRFYTVYRRIGFTVALEREKELENFPELQGTS
jgi:hypothetical protein